MPRCCSIAGKLLLEQHKRLLPFYDVFDEQRYFSPGALATGGRPRRRASRHHDLRGRVERQETSGRAGSTPSIPMEEIMAQHPAAAHQPLLVAFLARQAAKCAAQMLAAIARRDGIPVLLSNQVGGNDSLIFDGSSLALNARGEVIAQAASFEEDLLIVDLFHGQPVADPRRTMTPRLPTARWFSAPATTCASADSAR